MSWRDAVFIVVLVLGAVGLVWFEVRDWRRVNAMVRWCERRNEERP